ncbi:hypothetical protein VTI28DRAFT_1625 [Corynascus sepedonium]
MVTFRLFHLSCFCRASHPSPPTSAPRETLHCVAGPSDSNLPGQSLAPICESRVPTGIPTTVLRWGLLGIRPRDDLASRRHH